MATRTTCRLHVDGCNGRRARLWRRRRRQLDAYDDKTGEVLWETSSAHRISGFPVTYAVDGKQYVAISTSPTGVFRNHVRFAPDAAPKGLENRLFVFALP